jgi:hypothetical protein
MPTGTRSGVVPALIVALLLVALALAAAIPVTSRLPEPLAASALAAGQLVVAGWGVVRLRQRRTAQPVGTIAGPLTAAALVPALLLGLALALSVWFLWLAAILWCLTVPSFLRSLYVIGGLPSRRRDALPPGLLGVALAIAAALLVRHRLVEPPGFGGSGDWFLSLVLATSASVALVAALACWIEAPLDHLLDPR